MQSRSINDSTVDIITSFKRTVYTYITSDDLHENGDD